MYAVAFAADVTFLCSAGEHSSLELIVVVMLSLPSISVGALALVGEYLGCIFIETRGRPPFIVREKHEHPAEEGNMNA